MRMTTRWSTLRPQKSRPTRGKLCSERSTYGQLDSLFTVIVMITIWFTHTQHLITNRRKHFARSKQPTTEVRKSDDAKERCEKDNYDDDNEEHFRQQLDQTATRK